MLCHKSLPLVSLMTGRGLNDVLQHIFRDLRVEDLWLPYFSVSVDLAQSKEVIHRSGWLWRFVRSSMGLCGYLPPVCDLTKEGLHYLVDGGYSNTTPANIGECLGVIIRNVAKNRKKKRELR